MPRKKRMSVAPPIGEAFANMKVEATREVVVGPAEKRLEELDEPKAQRPPLLPQRWWENAGVAMEPRRRDPILVVSHQVAQVLNMGIDRAVEVGERAKADKEWADRQATVYRREYEWLRDFLRNTREHLQQASSATVVDRTVDVLKAIDRVLEREAIDMVLEQPL